MAAASAVDLARVNWPSSPATRSRCTRCPGSPAATSLPPGQALTVLGMAGALAARRGRAVGALSGAALLAASAATRWGVFHAGLASAGDPRYTVVPQRERLRRRLPATAAEAPR